MLRTFYIIILLLCLEWTLSYNHIDEAPGRRHHKIGRYAKRTRKLGRNRLRKNLIHQKYSYDRSPVDFDVASFIQPDDELVDEQETFKNSYRTRRRNSNAYDFDSHMDMGVNEANRRRDKSLNDVDFIAKNIKDENLDPSLRIDDISGKDDVGLNSLDEINSKYKTVHKDDDTSHHPEKKCALKHIKIPFFSHKKLKVETSKKPKKRKIFCFSYPKKNEKTVTQPPNAKKTWNDFEPSLQFKIKRSVKKKPYRYRKKNIEKHFNNVKRKKVSNEAHGADFFDQHPRKSSEDMNKRRKYNFEYFDDQSYYRKKREDPPSERLRQLKELEQVQRKIDNVRIPMPHYKVSNRRS